MAHNSCPCRGCEDRDETCHGICERYKTWRDEREKAKEEYAKKHVYPELSKRTMMYIYKRMKEGRTRK